MKSLFFSFLHVLAWLGLLSPAFAADRDIIYQVAPIQSLSVGIYDGMFSFGSLKSHGDIGIGTLNRLDGEMIFVDNVFYQIKSNGKAAVIPDSALTPFAVVTFFDNDTQVEAGAVNSIAELGALIDRQLPTRNLFYALRVDGVFEYVKVRSVPQQDKPYPNLKDAVKGQTVFEYRNIAGTLVGFRCPIYAEKVNVPGYHFHFLTADKAAGGHVLDVKFEKLPVRLDKSSSLMLVLPESGDFTGAELSGEEYRDLKKIE